MRVKEETDDTRANSHSNTQRQLILYRHSDSRDVLRGVSNDRQQNETDPFLAETRIVRNAVDTVDEPLGRNRDELNSLCEKKDRASLTCRKLTTVTTASNPMHIAKLIVGCSTSSSSSGIAPFATAGSLFAVPSGPSTTAAPSRVPCFSTSWVCLRLKIVRLMYRTCACNCGLYCVDLKFDSCLSS